MNDERKPEVLVNLSMRFPNLDPKALGEHLEPVVREALKLGGNNLHISTQPYDPDEDEFS